MVRDDERIKRVRAPLWEMVQEPPVQQVLPGRVVDQGNGQEAPDEPDLVPQGLRLDPAAAEGSGEELLQSALGRLVQVPRVHGVIHHNIDIFFFENIHDH